MVTIRNEMHCDIDAREALLDRVWGPSRSEKTAERLREAVMRKGIPHAANAPLVVTISLGCATFIPTEGSDATEIIAAADAALYAAKNAGRNRVAIAG